VSEPGFDCHVPPQTRGGVRANDVVVFRDPEHATIDCVRLGPRDPSEGIVVARVTLPMSCILTLVNELEGVV